VFLALFVGVLVTDNVPIQSVRRSVGSVEDKVLGLTGAQQVWGMFAPDPPIRAGEMLVRFYYRDGSVGTWRLPRRSSLVGSYSDYRWQKLGENAINRDPVGSSLLAWAAEHRAGTKPIEHADLIRRDYAIVPPGRPRTDHAPAREHLLFALRNGP
jgi:hypothetical protein